MKTTSQTLCLAACCSRETTNNELNCSGPVQFLSMHLHVLIITHIMISVPSSRVQDLSNDTKLFRFLSNDILGDKNPGEIVFLFVPVIIGRHFLKKGYLISSSSMVVVF